MYMSTQQTAPFPLILWMTKGKYVGSFASYMMYFHKSCFIYTQMCRRLNWLLSTRPGWCINVIWWLHAVKINIQRVGTVIKNGASVDFLFFYFQCFSSFDLILVRPCHVNFSLFACPWFYFKYSFSWYVLCWYWSVHFWLSCAEREDLAV
jgi:hypothetical protein